MTGTFTPDLTLHDDPGTTSVAELMHSARPVLLDLTDRSDLREAARDWQHRVEIRSAKSDSRPADALLIRPDAHIAWAAAVDDCQAQPCPRCETLSLSLVRRPVSMSRRSAPGLYDSSHSAVRQRAAVVPLPHPHPPGPGDRRTELRSSER